MTNMNYLIIIREYIYSPLEKQICDNVKQINFKILEKLLKHTIIKPQLQACDT